jgi:hypothetical protein
MSENPDYQRALGHVFDAVRGQGGGDGPLALSKLRASLSRDMDEHSVETLLQCMVQDGLLQPARSDGTVSLSLAGLRRMRQSGQGGS